MASPTRASLYTHAARYCDPLTCQRHHLPRSHRVVLDQPWRAQLRDPKPRKRHIIGLMDLDRRAATYLAQTGRSRLTARQLRRMRRMGRRQIQIPRPR